ncbi:transcriptional regulator [Alteraurantiacibacter aquimixticola]|uniref:Transcriptional regulator n=1 Tax=Alteraurantiacibacter aquimixticola TaxID=2489173 RepID=A0A4T3F3C8_9SPHN|nr:transcriptional regulator [Alteraurantiacibacter aquimixticola]TIX51755.1 transcriptional regulator [Alteraurantiacibacter aquimixticola]
MIHQFAGFEDPHEEIRDGSVFGPVARADFLASYPAGAHLLRHGLRDHPLLNLDALAQLASQLENRHVTHHRGDAPEGLCEKPGESGQAIGSVIRSIGKDGGWASLEQVQRLPGYRELLDEVLKELRPLIQQRTGKVLRAQATIIVLGPGASMPNRFAPEHQLLLQVEGQQVMTIFPRSEVHFGPDGYAADDDNEHEAELAWHDSFSRDGMPFSLAPGQAIYLPAREPHMQSNGETISISLAITWCSEWSAAEADARSFNGLLRKWGRKPQPPQRWPGRNYGKALAWRILKRIPWLH